MSGISSGIFTTDQLIEADKQICGQHPIELFGVNMKLLNPIIDDANSFDNIPDKKARTIKKVAHLIGEIVFRQPFTNGNKRTALAVGILFLRNNGFNLPYGDKENKKRLFELLEKTMFKFENDPSIVCEIENYLIENVIEN